MAFIDIASSQNRDKIVSEYVEKLKHLKEEQIENKMQGLARIRENEQTFQPIVKATQESAKAITSLLKKPDPSIYKSYTESSRKDLDRYFSIYKEGDKFKLGNKEVKIENNNVILDGIEYRGTPGLWNLLMLNTPENYEDSDLTEYLNLIESADVWNYPKKVPNSRPHSTSKAGFIENHIFDSEEEYEDTKTEPAKTTGEGIFLPSDINSLVRRLAIILSERRAGNNVATTPELVAILDELLNRKKITQQEYNAICKQESC